MTRTCVPLGLMFSVSLAGCGGGSGVGAGFASPPTVSPSTAATTVAPIGSAAPTASVSPLPASTVPASASPSPTASAATPRSAASPSPAGSAPVSPTATPSGGATAVPNGVVTYTPVDVAGPALDVPSEALAKSLSCTPNASGATQTVTLFVPGTDLTPDVDFAWNYERALTMNGMPWCAVTLPFSTTGDAQTAGEYVVNAIRSVYALSGRKIHVLGHSQGGMVPRWALRFWPDTRAMVDDVVGMAPSNHGTLDSAETGAERTPAEWQQAFNAKYIAAINSYQETFEGIHYTNIFTYTDEVVTPNSAVASSSSLSTGPGTISNVAIQAVCPNDVSEHLAIGTYDPVAYALVMDAFANGTASATRIPTTVCTQQLQPGVDPSTFAQNYAALAAYIANTGNDAPMVSAEPTMAPYVFTDHHG